MDLNFSLTEQCAITPVLMARADFVAMMAPSWQPFVSEIGARSIALSTSLFAAVDAAVHGAMGVYKVSNGTEKDLDEAGEHLRQSLRFACLVPIGSIAAFIWPDVVKHYSRPAPPIPQEMAPTTARLAEKMVRAKDNKRELEALWNLCSLEEKHLLAEHFNKNPSIRQSLADIVYQDGEWLSPNEIHEKMGDNSPLNGAFYFHSTSLIFAEPILLTGKIALQSSSRYPGAWVSTRPIPDECTFAFRKNIEFLSPLENGFKYSIQEYWAGFSLPIPVNEKSLACIILSCEHNCERLEKRIEAITGRKISVINASAADRRIDQICSLGQGIPKEWPTTPYTPLRK